MEPHKIVSREEWTAARKALLTKEKELTRKRDALLEERRKLPWVKVEKSYVFDTPAGRMSLGDLFEGRSQLVVYHFMFAPDWKEGCVGCSFLADHIDGANLHLPHNDVTFVAVSRAPLSEIQAYKKRMGWKFPWVSSAASDFNYDYHVSFTQEALFKGKVYYNYEMTESSMEDLPGSSVFYRDADGALYHTYSEYGRGGEEMLGAFMVLDRTPRGRNESSPMDWVRRHDKYGEESAGRAVAG